MAQSRIISFFSTKGGVGKTLIALNTAVALSRKNQKTILLDFDLRAPQGVSKLLGLKCKYSLRDIIPVFDKIITKEKPFKSYVSEHIISGVSFLPTIIHPREKCPLTPQFVKDFLNFLSKEYQYVIIDAGSDLTDPLMTTFELSNLILLPFTPDVAAIYQAGWLIDTLQSLGFPMKMIKIILNRAESKGGVSVQEIKLLLKPEIISLIPSDGRTVGLSVNKGVPVVLDAPYTKISIAFNALADDLIAKNNYYIEHKDLSELRIGKVKEEMPVESFLARMGFQEPSKKILQEEDTIVRLKKRIHVKLLAEIDLKRIPVEDIVMDPKKSQELREKAEKIIINIIAEEAGGFISSAEIRGKIIREILDESLGLGPLEDLLKDVSVTEVMVNNKDQVYIERKGKLELTTKKFTADEQVKIVIERILAPLGRRIDESSPYVDARLPDGSRVNAIIPPLSLTGPTLTIRKFAKEKLTVEDLTTKFSSLTSQMAEFIRASVKARKNILVSGGTGSGKTTLLNILSECIPDRERIITIEDSAELKLHHQHWIRLESRPPNIEGKGAITITDLFRNTLRMRPDRIVVGECRGKEVLDMLQAMNTGHDGSMSTIHANSTRDVLIRLDSMILMTGVELPIRAIREIIASALHMVIHTARLSDGTRKVTEITEVRGMADEMHIDLETIFKFQQTGLDENLNVLGDFSATGYIPSFYDDMIARGITLSKDIFKK